MSNSRDQCLTKITGHLKGATVTIHGSLYCKFRNWGASSELRAYYLVIGSRNWRIEKKIKIIRKPRFSKWIVTPPIKYQHST